MDEDTKETLRQPVAQRLAEDDIELQPDPDPDPHPDLSLAEGQLLTSVEPAMPTTTSDKAVSTCGITDLEDYQRAVTYEIVFNSLLEKKMQAMKRDCEERKRNKRLKRKSIGRIFMAKRLFSSVDSRKSSSISETGEENVHARTAPSTPQKLSQIAAKSANKEDDPQQMLSQQWQSPDTEINRKSLSHRPSPQLSRTRPKAKSITATTYESPKEQDTTQADDSITSTLSNSSGRIGNRSVLVLAQTHTHMQAENPISSSSGDSKQATSGQRTVANVPITKQDLTCDTASLASGYDNGPGARLNTNTIGDDSLASLRDSIESLSFASSRCTVSFGATEVIPEVIDNAVFERVRAAKRQRVLEAKSISAQCSPILPPRHIIKTMVHAPMSPPITKALTMPPAEPAAVPSHIDITEPLPPKTASPTPATITLGPSGTTRYLPNQFSYTDSLFESRNISRQNTSEESANLTLSTLLNQSDSLSLHASPSPTGDFRVADFTLSGRPVRTVDRFKSKSTGLLEATGNGRTRPPPPLPPPPFETAQPSPATSRSPISDARTKILPIEQLKQFHIASNAKKQHPFECYTATTPKHWLTESLTGSGQITTTAVAETTKFSHTKPLHVVTIGTAAMTPTTTPNPLLGKQYSKVDTSSQLDASSTSTLVGQPVNDVVLQSELHEAMTATEGDDIVTTALLNGAFIRSSSGTADAAKLLRMTSTSTGSSIGPTGCCTTTKTSSRLKEKQRFKPTLPTGQSGSDDEYRKKKRKYKRYHRCSDPVLVYPTSSGLQHCILSMPPNDPIQYPYTEDYAYDMQLQMESDKNDDLEKIVPSDSTKRKHHKHRHHRHKKRHRHKKPKILVQDLETQEVKVIDPDDLPQRARWTIIATACLLLLMCLMLVGITLRMAPIIDDMGEIGTMGKHRNATQNGLFLEFMEANTDLAKGYTKRDKVVVDALWRELADGLNGAGPPQKDVNGWKKIWTEWKSEIKKKLGHNKVEAHATGGGPFSQYQLTQTEESIVRLCGMKTTVEGVSGVSLGGDMSDIDEFLNDDMPTTSHKKSAKHAICSTPKRRTETTADRLTTFLDGDLELKKQLNEKLDSLAAGGKENGSSLKRIYRAIEKGTESITNVLEEIKNEYVRANNKMLLAVQEKNELKKQQLELELLKYQMQNRN